MIEFFFGKTGIKGFVEFSDRNVMIKRVMHVDDSSISQRFVKDTLRLVDPGLDVLLFSSAKDAIAKLESFAPEAMPDLILTDQAMPEMDGIEFIKWLKSHSKYHLIPIIMVSAESEEHRKKKVLSLGAFQYLEKPLQADLVILAFESAAQKLQEPKSEREAELHFCEEILDRLSECAPVVSTLNESSVQELKRHLHTIKGNASSYQYPVMSEFVNHLEKILEKAFKSDGGVTATLPEILKLSLLYLKEQAMAIHEGRAVHFENPELFKLMAEFGKPKVDPANEPTPGHHEEKAKGTAQPVVANDGISTRIQNEKLDQLQIQVKKVIQTKNKIANFSRLLKSEFPDEKFPDDLSKIQDELGEATAILMDFFISLRVVPITRIKDLLSKIISETSQKLVREVEYTVELDEQDSIDHEVLSRIETALVHTVRNSIDHGFDGRPNGNQLNFKIAKKGNDRFEIIVRDNGHGIQPEKIKETVLKKKIFDAQSIETLSHEQMLQLVFVDGLSTRSEATEISGRGVGLGAVKAELNRIGGVIQVTSEVGKGTEFRIEVPRFFRL